MRRRTRAVLIALAVVLSAIAVPIGTLAAPTTDVPATSSSNDALATQAQTDAQLRSGARFWQGWELSVDASGFIQEGERLEVWLVTDDGQLSQQVDTVTADADGMGILDTQRLAGRYVLRYGDQPVYVHQGVAYLSSPPDGSEVTVNASDFRVQRQTLTLEWSDTVVFAGQDTTLTVSSNRNRSVVAVTAEGLSFQNLTTLFPESTYATDHEARSTNDALLLDVNEGQTIRLNTTDLAPDSWQFDVEVVDTSARARPSLTVKPPGEGRRIISVERREHVGDVLEIELACTTCHMIVGTPEQETIDIVELQDGNGDGQVILHINTRYAGMYSGASGYPSNQPQYTSPNDTVDRYEPESTLEQVERELSYAVNTAGKLRDRLGLAATGRDRPIQPGRLQLTVASTDFIIPRSAWGDRAPYGSQMVIRDETDAVSVELQPRSLAGVVSMSGPGELDMNVESLRSNATPRHQIALGDRLVFRIDVTGLFGYVQAAGTDVDAFHRNDGEGIDLAMHRLDGGTDERLQLERVGVQFVPSPSENALYVVFGTGGARLNYLDAGRYRLTFTLTGVDESAETYSTQGAFAGYPYLEPGGRESVSASVTLDPATAAVTDPEPGISPRLAADGTLTLSGTATLAAGTSLRVHVTATEFAWETQARVVVGDQGGWTATLDLSEAPGESFEVTVSSGDQRLAEETYAVRPPAQTVTDDGGTGDGPSDGEGTADGGTPGAGATTTGDGSGDGTPASSGGGSIVPGISNLILFGSIFFLLMVVLLVARALM